MSVKRSRTARSSSFSDVVLSHRASPSAGTAENGSRTAAAFSGISNTAGRAPEMEAGRPRPGILCVSSPLMEEELSQEAPTGNFLEKCYYCKKMIREEDDVFMYGHLQAFCTPDCRDEQIAIDNSRRKSSGGQKGSRSGHCKMMNKK